MTRLRQRVTPGKDQTQYCRFGRRDNEICPYRCLSVLWRRWSRN